MTSILYDLVVDLETVTPAPPASTAFLNGLGVVVKPKVSAPPITSGIVEITNVADIETYTDNTSVQHVFNGGLNKIYLIINADLDISALLTDEQLQSFYTVLVTEDFLTTEVTGRNFGSFDGIVAYSAPLIDTAEKALAVGEKFIMAKDGDEGSLIAWIMGKYLSFPVFTNQQLISLPSSFTMVTSLGEAEALTDDGITFGLFDPNAGNRLAFFVAGKKAVITPYVSKQAKTDIQSDIVIYLSGAQPNYTDADIRNIKSVIATRLDKYVTRGQIVEYTVSIPPRSEQDPASFTVDKVSIGEVPAGAIWRIKGIINELVGV